MLLLVWMAPVVYCFSSGQVIDSCESMQPYHSGITAQTTPPPFNITTDNTRYTLGEEVKVQLQATASIPFTGFLLQAREVGGQSPLGTFSLTGGSAQHLSCNQKLNSAVSHTSDSVKTSIQVTWRPDVPAFEKTIQFCASVVQNYRLFWDVKSPLLTVTNDSTGGTTSDPTAGVSNKDCGVSKVCFSQPSNCDPTASADCYFMSARMLFPSDEEVRYEMTGSSDGYIAFGFSDDQIMGNDDIYICGIGSNGLVQLQRAFSTGRTAPQILPLGNVSDVRASVQGSIISCSFTSMNTPSTVRTTGFNNSYYLMFVYGPSKNGLIQLHTSTFISTEKISISKPMLVGKAGLPQIIKAHGALMLTAWMSVATLGLVVARYRNGFANGKKLWGKDIWFLVHAFMMSLTVTATAIAFILSFSYVRAWSGGAHPVLGCLVMILSFIQILLALVRCGPQHPLRFLFNWTHALNGVGIKALSVAAILTGFRLIDNTPEQWLMKVMGGFVGWEALFYILLSANLKWKVHGKGRST
ncbi:putative ferric-chelate reductase 1 isoform X1 [Xyrichtys novacula]|uniref:Ferric-chelate reductase 1 isoform X1 n=1 Tax=Xyrichtys novacula TaxID=13765 RepID=A0AAV1HAH0_XYRNO|nr:putative ferric-chelate reductase 1 isoform X1 [Xyrichtys novacula]